MAMVSRTHGQKVMKQKSGAHFNVLEYTRGAVILWLCITEPDTS